MLIKAFSVRSLQKNLGVGNGANVQVPLLKKVTVVFGTDKCPAKSSLSSFYVNELPRIYKSNPHIQFSTLPEEADHCELSLSLGNDHTVSIDLRECLTSASMYNRIMTVALPPATSPQ
ncbi:uncharacterized protein SPPG_09255 [Spizellomyces punctatus DAOM BR117]|uniref:Ribosomal protein/NADH dehydrogenase domain-containing protein n=1 Tax=Spizellomyces punctatus (strain DAOM BR117) TaxID=645134 RepID=A0A0L0HFM9_SPIPD|nr:uncharacterized protein SPPG_09255 [Spizellomyces punctatus DAOM BR117]KNC99729.1 hypothetical protein SPPG_09255 [Spizellomyces punctatus DAOM BR117]|eukprot:XP_016607769.1 hypothetical protein SPPG_09255 [Spizellomyces punctatus DAOM BR117]